MDADNANYMLLRMSHAHTTSVEAIGLDAALNLKDWIARFDMIYIVTVCS